MTFNTTAASLIRAGYAKQASVGECMGLLHKAYDYNLVQFGENVQNNVNFICNCCKCCCEAMIAARKFAFLNPVHTTGFTARIESSCTGCGKCVSICPVDAIELVSIDGNSERDKKVP